jgi:hypothetical protein
MGTYGAALRPCEASDHSRPTGTAPSAPPPERNGSKLTPVGMGALTAKSSKPRRSEPLA